MRSIQRRFNNIIEKSFVKSSYLCFTEAIKGQGFSERIIRRWFIKLVDKDDYAKCEKGAVVEFLVGLTNSMRKVGNKGKLAPRGE